MPSTQKPLVVRIPDEHLLALKALARRKAVERDARFTTSDLVREALVKAYPSLLRDLGDDDQKDTAN